MFGRTLLSSALLHGGVMMIIFITAAFTMESAEDPVRDFNPVRIQTVDTEYFVMPVEEPVPVEVEEPIEEVAELPPAETTEPTEEIVEEEPEPAQRDEVREEPQEVVEREPEPVEEPVEPPVFEEARADDPRQCSRRARACRYDRRRR